MLRFFFFFGKPFVLRLFIYFFLEKTFVLRFFPLERPFVLHFFFRKDFRATLFFGKHFHTTLCFFFKGLSVDGPRPSSRQGCLY